MNDNNNWGDRGVTRLTGVTGQKEEKVEREKEEKEETVDLKTQTNEGNVALCRLAQGQLLGYP